MPPHPRFGRAAPPQARCRCEACSVRAPGLVRAQGAPPATGDGDGMTQAVKAAAWSPACLRPGFRSPPAALR